MTDQQQSPFDIIEKAEVPDEYMSEYDGFEEDWMSNSSMSTVMICGIKFLKKYINREREPRAIRSTAGLGGHKGREVNLRQKILSGEDLNVSEVTDAARDYVQNTFDNNEFQIDKEFEGKSKIQLRGITTDFATSIALLDRNVFQPEIQPKLVEHPMAMKIEGMSRIITGKTDVIEIDDRVRDLKSGKRAFGQSKADENTGLTNYGLLRYTETGEMPPEYLIDSVVCSGKTSCKHKGYVTSRSKAQLVQHLNRFIVWNRIIDAGLFGPCDSQRWECSEAWCGYWSQCEFGKARSV